jgi:hypothetical protein
VPSVPSKTEKVHSENIRNEWCALIADVPYLRSWAQGEHTKKQRKSKTDANSKRQQDGGASA